MKIIYIIIGILGWIFICLLYVLYVVLVWYCIDLFYREDDDND